MLSIKEINIWIETFCNLYCSRVWKPHFLLGIMFYRSKIHHSMWWCYIHAFKIIKKELFLTKQTNKKEQPFFFRCHDSLHSCDLLLRKEKGWGRVPQTYFLCELKEILKRKEGSLIHSKRMSCIASKHAFIGLLHGVSHPFMILHSWLSWKPQQPTKSPNTTCSNQ